MGKDIKKETIVIKIGTSALSKDDGMPDEENVLRSLVDQICTLKTEGHRVILVSSGAVGIGRALRGYSTKDAFRDAKEQVTLRQKCAATGQHHLMGVYQNLLPKDKDDKPIVFVEQILLTANDFVTPNEHALTHMKNSMNDLKSFPIVNANDVTDIEELMISDNDQLACLLAETLKADRLIILSNVKGVETYRGSGQVIPVVNFGNPMTLPQSTEGMSGSGTGGMASKMRVAERLTALGIKTDLASSKEPNAVLRIVAGQIAGTRFTDTRFVRAAKLPSFAPAS